METKTLTREDLRRARGFLLDVDDRVPAEVTAIGSVDILEHRLLGLFCAARCPPGLVAAACQAARGLRDAKITTAGGFHSPVEKECLSLLLEGRQPVVVCPPRSLEEVRQLPVEWLAPISEGRMLLLSAFGRKITRADAESAARRNRLVAALSDELFVVHASPGGKTEELCRDVITWGKPILTLDAPENAGLITLGAHRVQPETMAKQLAVLRLGL